MIVKPMRNLGGRSWAVVLAAAVTGTLALAHAVPVRAGLLLPGPENEELDAARRVAYFVERKSPVPGFGQPHGPFVDLKKFLGDGGFYEAYAAVMLERLAPQAAVTELTETDFKKALAVARAGNFDLLVRMTVDPWLDAREDYPKSPVTAGVEADLKIWRVSDGDTLWLCPERSHKTVYVDMPTSTPPDVSVHTPFRVLDESYLRNAVDVLALFNEVALDVARRYDINRHVGGDYKHVAEENRRFFDPLLEDPRISGAFHIVGSTEKGREASITAGRVVFTGDASDWRYSVVNGLGHVRVSVELDLTKPAIKAVFDAVTADLAAINAECGTAFESLQDTRPPWKNMLGKIAGRDRGSFLVQKVHKKKLSESEMKTQREWAITNLLRIKECLVSRFETTEPVLGSR